MVSLRIWFVSLIAVTSPVIAGGAFVLDDEGAKGVFNQCSRLAPEGIEEVWTPGPDVVNHVGFRIQEYLNHERQRHDEFVSRNEAYYGPVSFKLSDFVRQYVGFSRAGNAYVYVNIVPDHDIYFEGREKTEPLMVCDGGPSFWGVEFDIDKDEIVAVEFNGMI